MLKFNCSHGLMYCGDAIQTQWILDSLDQVPKDYAEILTCKYYSPLEIWILSMSLYLALLEQSTLLLTNFFGSTNINFAMVSYAMENMNPVQMYFCMSRASGIPFTVLITLLWSAGLLQIYTLYRLVYVIVKRILEFIVVVYMRVWRGENIEWL